MPTNGQAQAATPVRRAVHVIRDIRRRATPTAAQIEIEFASQPVGGQGETTSAVPRGVEFRDERLAQPSRWYFDLRQTRPAGHLSKANLTFESGLVRQIRVGQRRNETTRVVLEAAGVNECVATFATAPNRLMIFCYGAAAPTPAPEPRAPPVPPPTPPVADVAPARPPEASPVLSPVPASALPLAATSTLAPAIVGAHAWSTSAAGGPASAPPLPPMVGTLPLSSWPVGGHQPSVQLVSATQFTTGDEIRLGGQHRVEPDLGLQLLLPGLSFGNLYADVNITRRDGHATVGRSAIRLDGLKARGLLWALDAGNTWNPPVVADFGFANLFAPPVTLQGGSLQGMSPSTVVLVTVGRVMAQRNIFGTDNTPVGQELYQAAFSHRQHDSFDYYARGVYVRSRDMTLYTQLVDRSREAGGGARYRPGGSLQLVADAGFTVFRRHGSPAEEQAAVGLLGALWSVPRGWLQLNAQQFPLGHYPVANFPYSDRSGVFAAGEFDLASHVRVTGGGEYAKSNLDRAASTKASSGVPPGSYTRGYGGVLVRLAQSSLLSLRAEAGGRDVRPSRFGPGYTSDTGAVMVEWSGRFAVGNAFARYAHRSNADYGGEDSSFTQHDASAQMYFALPKARQIFAQAIFSQRADRSGTGQTLWQVGLGSQTPIGRLYARLEATAGRTRDWYTNEISTRQALSVGLSGTIASRTYLSIDTYVDRSPSLALSGSPWVTRTMVRLTRTFPFGSAQIHPMPGQPSRGGPSGRIAGTIFTDWDGNGVMDPGDEPRSGITVSLGPPGSLTSGTDGRFVFSGVPVGMRTVSLDIGSVPADLDPPSDTQRSVTVGRSQTSTVSFGLLPLGSIQGVVFQDVDGDGALGVGDTPVDRAVLILDDGARTELTRDGRFRFDAIRLGTHNLALVLESLPEGAQVAGEGAVAVEIIRDRALKEVVFLIKLEKRQEIRKVFPPKKSG